MTKPGTKHCPVLVVDPPYPPPGAETRKDNQYSGASVLSVTSTTPLRTPYPLVIVGDPVHSSVRANQKGDTQPVPEKSNQPRKMKPKAQVQVLTNRTSATGTGQYDSIGKEMTAADTVYPPLVHAKTLYHTNPPSKNLKHPAKMGACACFRWMADQLFLRLSVLTSCEAIIIKHRTKWRNSFSSGNGSFLSFSRFVKCSLSGHPLTTLWWWMALPLMWLFCGWISSIHGQASVVSFSSECNWTWVGGANVANTGTTAAVFGARLGHTVAVNGGGAVFAFGGQITSGQFRNDMWQWTPATLQWSLRSGTATAVVGGSMPSLGSTGMPGSRRHHAMAIDPSKNLIYLMGGVGFDGSSNWDHLNDLWRYDPTLNTWTWVGGSNLKSQLGTYGARGLAATGNAPGARSQHAMIFANHSLVVFGGYGYGAATWGSLNDLWQWNISTRIWTWWRGSDQVNALGINRTLGVPSVDNTPSARELHAMTHDPNTGMAIMFGGNAVNGQSNEIWQLNTNIMIWTWFGGGAGTTACQLRSYGVKSIASPGNFPGIRSGHQMSIIPQTGSVLLFGGLEGCRTVRLNDLWLWDPVTKYWTWFEGPNQTESVTSSYGSQFVSSALNSPPAREQFAMSTHPTTGLLYVVGGSPDGTNRLNDLWQMQPVQKQCPDGSILFADSCLAPEVLASFPPFTQPASSTTHVIRSTSLSTAALASTTVPDSTPQLAQTVTSSAQRQSTSASTLSAVWTPSPPAPDDTLIASTITMTGRATPTSTRSPAVESPLSTTIPAAIDITTCPNNATADTNDKTKCTCNPGYYGSQGQCDLCPRGCYCAGGAQIRACGRNSDTASAGATNASACLCDPGYFGSSHLSCQKCTLGKYCPGGAVVTACPTGATSSAGASSITECQCPIGLRLYQAICQQCTMENGCLQDQQPPPSPPQSPPPAAAGPPPPLAGNDAMTNLFSNGLWSALFASSFTAVVIFACIGSLLIYRRYRQRAMRAKQDGHGLTATTTPSAMSSAMTATAMSYTPMTTTTTANSMADGYSKVMGGTVSRRIAQSYMTTMSKRTGPVASAQPTNSGSSVSNQSTEYSIAVQHHQHHRRPLRAVAVSASVRRPSAVPRGPPAGVGDIARRESAAQPFSDQTTMAAVGSLMPNQDAAQATAISQQPAQ